MSWSNGWNQIESMYAVTDPATNAAVGTAIVNVYNGVLITTTTTGNSQTLQSPSATAVIKYFTVVNNDTSSNTVPVVANSVTYTIAVGSSLIFMWDGSKWLPTSLSNIITGATITGSTFAFTDYQPIPIEAGYGGTTPPAAAAELTSTNTIIVRKFQGASANQDLFFQWEAPADLTGSTITYRVKYAITESTVPANTETVKFTLAGVGVGAVTGSYTTDQLISHALGTAVTVTDTYATATLPAQYAIIQTAWSAAVTVTHLAAGKSCILSLVRDQANDTYAQNIGVTAIELCFTRTLA